MSLSPDQYYVIGEPVNYSSIYGYPKRRFPVHRADELGNKQDSSSVGEIKEEPMLDENGQLWGRCFYTKTLGRPTGKYRFYPSPEALIVACGGKATRKPAANHPIQTGDVHPAATDEDAQDVKTATQALASLDSGATSLVKGDELEKRLSALEAKIDDLTLRPRKAKGAVSGRSSARNPATAQKPAKSKKVKGPPRRKKVTL